MLFQQVFHDGLEVLYLLLSVTGVNDGCDLPDEEPFNNVVGDHLDHNSAENNPPVVVVLLAVITNVVCQDESLEDPLVLVVGTENPEEVQCDYDNETEHEGDVCVQRSAEGLSNTEDEA